MTEYPPKAQELCAKLKIKHPLIQAGMVWVSGGKLAAAAANAGILGIVGAGSMRPELLKEHLKKARNLSSGSIGVNIPLLYKNSEMQIQTALDEGVRIFITSAGSPRKYTKLLKDEGAIVIHVTSHPALAKKCEEAGCDMVIAEGFEAGGHNGRDELTTLTLIPQTLDAVSIPVIAAGGFASGESVLAGLALGASGIQMGTRFVCSQESSAHINFQSAIVDAEASDTKLMMKKTVPVRLLKNDFFNDLQIAEDNCRSNEELIELLGKGRAKAGMLEGDLKRGELEIGQISGAIKDRPSVEEIVRRIHAEYIKARAAFLA